jgi:acyl-CoA thioesterase II
VAAYGSDLMLLGTTLLQTPEFRPKMMASLDHSMWFHCPFRADEWMLYEIHSQRLCKSVLSPCVVTTVKRAVWDIGIM